MDEPVNGADEQAVREFLHSRIAFWETLPYDWMELDEDTIDDLNLLNVPEDVLAPTNGAGPIQASACSMLVITSAMNVLRLGQERSSPRRTFRIKRSKPQPRPQQLQDK